MNLPAFLLYPADFFAEVAGMSQAEVGAYIMLKCWQWQSHFLPCENDRLERIAKGPLPSHVLDKFPLGTDGKRRNVDMEALRTKSQAFSNKRSMAGKLGATARWQTHPVAIGKPMAKRWLSNQHSSQFQINTNKGLEGKEKAGEGHRPPTFVALKLANQILANETEWAYDNCKVDPKQLSAASLRSVIEPFANVVTDRVILSTWNNAVTLAHSAKVDGLAKDATAYAVQCFKNQLQELLTSPLPTPQKQ